jgi:HTH-type transcriptional regulator/antitoxin HigA
VDVKPYSEQAFSAALPKLKNLLRNPEDTRQVPRVLAEAGVRFLVVETLPQTRIDGVIAVTLRFDRIDGFWHTLLHECKHVRQKDGLDEGALLDKDLVGETMIPLDERLPAEKDADEFAANFTIPKGDLENFISRVYPLFSKTKILGLAARLDIHPGIVVGQLQYRKAIPYSHSREMLARIRNIVTESALTDGFGSVLATAF